MRIAGRLVGFGKARARTAARSMAEELRIMPCWGQRWRGARCRPPNRGCRVGRCESGTGWSAVDARPTGSRPEPHPAAPARPGPGLRCRRLLVQAGRERRAGRHPGAAGVAVAREHCVQTQGAVADVGGQHPLRHFREPVLQDQFRFAGGTRRVGGLWTTPRTAGRVVVDSLVMTTSPTTAYQRCPTTVTPCPGPEPPAAKTAAKQTDDGGR